MPKRPKHASKPIETEDEAEISASQRKHYEKLGYKPYLSHGGKIKWLSADQHVYELIKYSGTKKIQLFNRPAFKKPKLINYSKVWLKLFASNWLLLILFLIIVLILVNFEKIMDYLTVLI